MDQETLDQIAAKLQENSMNYSVFLRVYDVEEAQAKDALTVIQHALRTEKALLGGIGQTSAESVWPDIEESLLYSGDTGAGPSDASLRSDAFRALLRQLECDCRALTAVSTNIERFWLKEGHPGYPVFWDFAFLFWRTNKATVLIGSSSD